MRTNEATYKYVVDKLCEELKGTDIEGAGSRDKKVDPLLESNLCILFERYIYREPKDPIILMDRGGQLRVFNGRHYETAVPEFMSQVVKRVMERMDVGAVYQNKSYSRIAAQCLEGMNASALVEFNANRDYVAFNNGLFELKSGLLQKFDSRIRTDLFLDFDYKRDIDSELWETKLVEIIPDSGMREALQSFLGCMLIDRKKIKIEYVCFLLGPGGNGKSVLINAVVDAFGEDLFTRFSPEQLFRSQQAMYHLAELDGKIANFCDDVSNNDFSGGDFKRFVSGEAFQARHPYQAHVFKVPSPLMICCANEMPPTSDDTDGFHRRILPITSTGRVLRSEERDPELQSKMRAEDVKQTIFNWVYDGYKRIVESHGVFSLAQSVKDTGQILREDSNSGRRWIRDVGYWPESPKTSYDEGWVQLKDLYAEYREYCKENGEVERKSVTIAKLLRQLGFVIERRTEGMWVHVGRGAEGVEYSSDMGETTSPITEERKEKETQKWEEKEFDLPF